MDLSVIAKIVAFALYLGLMVYVGLRHAKGNNSASDFFLGNRGVGPWVTALSAEASDSSAWLLMGLPGLCYAGGFNETLWTALGLIAGTYLAWLIIAKPLRKCSIAFGDSITVPEFLSNRFKDKTHVLSVVSVIFIVVFFTIYTASGFVACAKLFNSVFGLDWNAGLLIGFVIILSYTIMGGYKAVCTTDFIQGTLIVIAFVVTGVILFITLNDGNSSPVEKVQDFMGSVEQGNFGETLKNTLGADKGFSPMSAISAFAWCLGYFGMPHIIVRFMGCRSNKEIKTARRVGITWMIIAYVGTFIIGTLGTAYLFKNGKVLNLNAEPLALEQEIKSEKILDENGKFVKEIFTDENGTVLREVYLHENEKISKESVLDSDGKTIKSQQFDENGNITQKTYLDKDGNEVTVSSAGDRETVFSKTMDQMFPPFIAGIFLCAILAAAMSTADSQLLAASSAIGQDIYKGLLNKNADNKNVLNVSRISVLIIAIIGLLLALDPESSIFNLVSFAWSGFGGTFGPLIILALYWKNTTAKGAIAGLICGGITDVVWHYLSGGIFDIYEILPAFIVCLVVTVIVSIMDKNKDPEMIADFEKYKAMAD